MSWRVVAALLALGLASTSPIASALTTGDFLVRGDVGFPEGAAFVMPADAVYVPDVRGISRFSLVATHAWVTPFEKRIVFADVNGQRVGVEQETVGRQWAVTHLRLDMTAHAREAGFLGLDAPRGGALKFEAPAGSQWAARATGVVGAGPRSAQPSDDWYARPILRPHLVTASPGWLEFHGSGAIKLMGPDFRLASAENTTHHKTGSTPESPAELVARWLHVEFEDGVLEVVSATPVEIAAPRILSASWVGTVSLTPVAGSLRNEGDVYVAGGRRVTVTGDFVASVLPASTLNAADVVMRGELRGTSLPASAAVGEMPWDGAPASRTPLLLAAVVVAAGGLATVALYARHRVGVRRERAMKVAECVANARLADASHDRARALDWMSRARALEPTDPALLLEAAWHLAAVGRHQEAVEAYAEAARHSSADDGGANLAAAVVHVECTRDLEAAAREVAEALRRQPALQAEVELEDELCRALRGHPAFEDAMTRAAVLCRVRR